MATLTVRPLRPALSLPSSCMFNPERNTTSKLSLLIPPNDSSPAQLSQTTSRITCTPVASKRPKLSLSFGNESQRSFTTSGSFSSSRLPSCSPSDDYTTSEEEITSRNTIANTHLVKAITSSLDCSSRWVRTYNYTETSGKKSILKGSPSCYRTRDDAVMSRNVTFLHEPTVIPASYFDDSEDEDLDNLSPPSTTSSTDSEESESDSEPKTPIDDDEDFRGRSWDRFSATSRGGKWRRPKREWVWTLGGSDSTDIMQELEYSSANLIQVESM